MKKIITWASGLVLLLAFYGLGWAGTLTPNGFLYKPSLGARGAGEKGLFDSSLERVDARLGKEIWVGDPDYGTTIQDAITRIGSANVSLHVPPGTYSLGANLTVPANVHLKLQRGAVLLVATGKTLTVNGPLEAGLYQIFSCTGTGKVDFSSNKVIKEVSPYWWGATFDGTTVDTAALQAAFNAGAVVGFPRDKTCKTGQLTIASNLHIEGNGSTIERDAVSAPGDTTWCGSAEYLLKATTATSSLTIRNLKFNEHHSADATHYRSSIGFYEDITDILIEGCEFTDSQMGVALISYRSYAEAELPATRVTIRNCKMVGPSYLADGGTINYLIHGNKLFSLGAAATYCLIEGNYVENIGGLGVLNMRVDGSGVPYQGRTLNAYCQIINNACKNTIDSTIYTSGHGHIISGNKVIRPGGVGIVVNSYNDPVTGERYSHDCVISNNYVEGAGRTSPEHGANISCWADNSTISNNTIVLENPIGKASSFAEAFNINASNVTISGNAVKCKDGLVANTHFIGLNYNTNKINVVGNTVQDVAYIMSNLGEDGHKHVSLQGNIFRNFTGGISSGGTCATPNAYWTISNNHFDKFTGTAINCFISDGYTYGPIPIYWTIANNTFEGNGSSAIGIAVFGAGRFNVSNNIFSGNRDCDVKFQEGWNCGPVFGSGNISDGLNLAGFDYRIIDHPLTLYSAPTVGTWWLGERAYKISPSSAGPIGWVCTASGTLGTLHGGTTTGSIGTGTATLTVNNAVGIYPGCFITIAGVTGVKKVTAVVGTTVTIDVNSDATVSGAAVSYSAPTFKTWGAIN